MDIVSSRHNPHFKQLDKLLDSSRERRKAGQTVLEGIHLLQAWREAGRPLALIVAAESALAHPEVAGLWPASGARLLLQDALFTQLFEISPGVGIAAVVDIPKPDGPPGDFIVLLDDVQDPLNIGGILRTAAAAGATSIYLSKGCAEAWSPKVLRGGMGGHLGLAIHEHADLLDVAARYHGKVVATSLDDSLPLFDADLRGPLALVFGNEGAGVSQAIQATARQRVRIPMPGAVESLNVAAAAAICLFEKVRQSQST